MFCFFKITIITILIILTAYRAIMTYLLKIQPYDFCMLSLIIKNGPNWFLFFPAFMCFLFFRLSSFICLSFRNNSGMALPVCMHVWKYSIKKKNVIMSLPLDTVLFLVLKNLFLSQTSKCYKSNHESCAHNAPVTWVKLCAWWNIYSGSDVSLSGTFCSQIVKFEITLFLSISV